jgi:putative ABC transport system ATP-binding protein
MVRVDGNGNGKSLICLRGLDKSYHRGGEEIHVLQGLNLDVEKGEFVAFMGPSGSGKTTLLNLVGGLDVPTRSPTCPAASSRSGGPATWGSSSRPTT